MAYTGTLFGNSKKPESQHQSKDLDKLVKIQADQLRSVYNTDCLDVKQIQQVLNVGESTAYRVGFNRLTAFLSSSIDIDICAICWVYIMFLHLIPLVSRDSLGAIFRHVLLLIFGGITRAWHFGTD